MAAVGKLEHFDAKNTVEVRHTYFKYRFKFLVFVPVNDSEYATKIPRAMRNAHDLECPHSLVQTL